MPEPISPKRGEIWLANFDPTLGTEIKKVRPAVILSADAIGRLPIKLVAPITDWKPYFESNLWHIKLEPTTTNGLSKTSAIDALQLRGLDTLRFIRKLGHLSPETMAELTIAVVTVIEAS
jgi:mRNA interferase MazF